MDFSDSHVSVPDGKMVKGLELATYITSADVVITLPKLKTHSLMYLTGATKILFGAVPGTLKLAYHAKFPDRIQFSDMLIDILSYIQPALSLMDAVEGMDGAGPTAGSPFPIGAILASTDSVALDIVAARLVKMDIEDIPTIQAALRRGMTNGQIEDILIVGEKLQAFHINGFRSPETRADKKSLRTLLGRHLRTFAKDSMVAAPFATDACTACGICSRSCPVQAISIPDDRAIMDLKECIRCYCCHEFCPQRAIELKMPLLGRMLGQWR
jgi:ferredoxin